MVARRERRKRSAWEAIDTEPTIEPRPKAATRNPYPDFEVWNCSVANAGASWTSALGRSETTSMVTTASASAWRART